MKRSWQALAAGLLVLPLGACVLYDRNQVGEPVAEPVLAELHPGQALGECLGRLGAPTQVYEYRGDGMALLWAWRDTGTWSLDVSVPLQDQISASFDLDLADTEARGCMLWFDADLRLERLRSGRLGELLPGRARPSGIEPAGG